MSNPLWSLPGPRRFVRGLVEDLADGRNLVLALPDTDRPVGLPAALREACRLRLPHLEWESARLAHVAGDPHVPIVDRLWNLQALHREAGQRLDVATLIDHHSWQGQILLVNAADATDEMLAGWSAFLTDYQSAVYSLSPTARTRVVTLLSGERVHRAPAADVLVAHHWWWGSVTRVDTAVHVAEGGSRLDPAHAAAIVEVAAFDLDLAEVLLTNWNGSLRTLCGLLDDYAADQLKTSLGASAVPTGPAPADRPTAGLLSGWAQGLVQRWDDGSVCVHRACLEDAAVQRLVWRAQLSTVARHRGTPSAACRVGRCPASLGTQSVSRHRYPEAGGRPTPEALSRVQRRAGEPAQP